MPKPNTCDSTCNAVIMKTFLFDLEQYFDTIGVWDEASKVSTMSTYHYGTSQLW